MKIVDVRQTAVPIRSKMKNAFISFSEMTVSLVAVVSDVVRDGERLIGFGFNSNGRYAQSGILADRMIPRLRAADPEAFATPDGRSISPPAAWQLMMKNEKPGGHGDRSVAVGALDMALWDLAAKLEEKPLYRLIAERYRDDFTLHSVASGPDPEVPIYAGGGYYDEDKGIEGLKEEMQGYLDSGYTTVKMKIGGAPLAEDVIRIEAVLSLLPGGEYLAVDANGRFDLETALEYTEALSQYGLLWFEEPGDPLDYRLNSEVSAASSTPIATGENLFSRQEVVNLLRYGGMHSDRDYLQMDPSLGYGLTEYVRMVEAASDDGWSRRRCIPHGGHQFGLQIAAGMELWGNESYPGVFEPFGGFADGVRVENGRVRIPNAPGIGIERKAALYRLCRELVE